MATRSSRGSARRLSGKTGWWCQFKERKPDGGYRTISRRAGETKRAAEALRARVVEWLDKGETVERAFLLAQGKAAPTDDARAFAAIVREYMEHPAGLLRRKASTQAVARTVLGLVLESPWAALEPQGIEEVSIRAWAMERMGANGGTTAGTINNYLSTASAVWRWAVKAGKIPRRVLNPFPLCRLAADEAPKASKARVGLDADEAQALLTAIRETCPPAAVAILEGALFTGWRLGDLAALRWEDYDHAYTVKGTHAPRLAARRESEKTGARKVSFPQGALLRRLEALRTDATLRPHPKARIFTQPNGSAWGDPKRTNHWLRKALKAIPSKDVPAWKLWGDDFHAPFTLHSIRHTAETVLHELGASGYTIDAMLGHSSGRQSRMGARYTTVTEAQLLDASRLLDGALGSPSGSPKVVATRRGTAQGGAK